MPKLIAALEGLLKTLQQKFMPDFNEELYKVAYSSIGKDLSSVVDNEVACSEVVSRIIQKAFPELKFPTIVSTRELFNYLNQSPSFESVEDPRYGDIILSVTASGNGTVTHGHCGIRGKNWIMSNDSRTGVFEGNYSFAAWDRYYRIKGGFPTHYYRRT